MLAAQLAVNALALGAAYALVALGFVLVLNATTAVNFAHGDAVVAGSFAAVALAGLLPAGLPVPGLALLPAVLLVMAGFGVALSAIAYLPIRSRPPVSVFVTTIAAGIIVANGLNAAFGAAPRAAPPLVSAGAVSLAGIEIAVQSLAIIATAGVLIGALAFLLGRTQLGRRMRACAQDPEMARALGIDLTATTLVAFALGAALAGAAGLLLAHRFFVAPGDGGALMLKAYIAVAIGGWGSLRGAATGALLIAVFEVGVATVFSQPVAEGLLYLALFAVLLVRPKGLFGEAAGQRA